MIPIFALMLFAAPAADEWTALQPPILCRAPLHAALEPPLLDGSHLRLAGQDPSEAETDALAPLPYPTFLQMLEDDARARGTRLEIQRQAGACLVRGDAAAISAARALIADLDRAARAQDIGLVVTLTAKGTTGKPGGFSTERHVRSGETVFLGARETRSYVASFDIEVAADSGSSEPTLGRAYSGQGVHLRAVRVDGGKRVFLWGLLDCAEILALENFDPGTVDLGVIQLPRIQIAQAAFAGVVDSGAALEVSISGTGLTLPDLTLQIQARTSADPEPVASDASDERGFAVLDMALLAQDLPVLVPCEPGSGLAREGRARAGDPPTSVLPPSAIAAMVENGRGTSSSSRGTRGSLYWTDRMLFVPRADGAAVREARSIVRGLEGARLSTSKLEISVGALKASVPICSNARARLFVGTERSFLVDYRLEVAPQIWMPVPTVENAFDGVCLDVQSMDGSGTCSLWSARSGAVQELDKEAAQIGRLQLVSRSSSSGTAQLQVGAKEPISIDLSGAPQGVARVRLVGP